MIEDKLIERMKIRGLQFSPLDMITLRDDLKKCLDEERYHFIENKYGDTIGFITWENIYRNGKRFVWLNNCFLDEKSPTSLLRIRKSLRQKIDSLGGQRPEFYYWGSQKKGKFYYAK